MKRIVLLLAVTACSTKTPAKRELDPCARAKQAPKQNAFVRPPIGHGLRMLYDVDLTPAHAAATETLARSLVGALPGATHRVVAGVIELDAIDAARVRDEVKRRCGAIETVACATPAPTRICVRASAERMSDVGQETLEEAAHVVNRRFERANQVGFASVAGSQISVELPVIDDDGLRRARELVDRIGEHRLVVLEDDAPVMRTIAAHLTAKPVPDVSIITSGEIEAARWQDLVVVFEQLRAADSRFAIPSDRMMAYERRVAPDGRVSWRAHLLADSLEFPVATTAVTGSSLEISLDRRFYDGFSRAGDELAGKRLGFIVRNRVVGTLAAEAIGSGTFTVPVADEADAKELSPLLDGGMLPAALRFASVGEYSQSEMH